MRIKPVTLTCIALFVGVGLGLAVLDTQRYVAKELLGLLDEAAQKSGPYKLQWTDASITFFPLMASARDVSLIGANGVELKFKKLEADFDISEIFNKHIDLADLRMYGGDAEGFGPNSGLYRYIDFLTSLGSDEGKTKSQDNSSDWKINLLKLTVYPAELNENVLGIPIKASGATLNLQKGVDETYELRANLPGVEAKLSPTNTVIGSGSAVMALKGNGLEFKSLSFQLPGVQLSANGAVPVSHSTEFDTKVNASIDLDKLPIPVFANGQLAAEANVTGPAKDTAITSSIRNASKVEVGNKDVRTAIDSLALLVKGSLWENHYSLDIKQASGENIEIKTDAPIVLQNGMLDGSVKIHSSKVSAFEGTPNAVTLNDFTADVNLSGPLTSPQAVAKLQLTAPVIGKSEAMIATDGQGLNFDFSSENDQIHGQGKILLESTPRLTNTAFQINIPGMYGSSITGSATVDGPMTVSQLKADTHLVMRRGDTELLYADGSLNRGSLTMHAFDSHKTVDISAEDVLTDDKSGKATIKANNFNGLALLIGDDTSCSLLAGEGTFLLPSGFAALPQGSFKVSKFSLGCNPYNVNIKEPVSIDVSASGVNLPGVTFVSEQGSVNGRFNFKKSINDAPGLMHGELSGGVDLKNILPLMPQLDDLTGIIAGDAIIDGPIDAPKLTGKMRMANAAFSANDGLIDAEHFSGSFLLEGQKIQLDGVKGTLNDGSVNVTGDVTVPDGGGNLRIQADGVTLSPSLSTSITLQSDIQVQLGPTKVSGTVQVTQGLVEENVELFNLLQGNESRKREATAAIKEVLGKIPFETDIAIEGDRTIAINSNLLSSDVSVHGKIAVHNLSAVPPAERYNKPQNNFSFTVDTDSGWVLFGDKRFDIRSAQVVFNDSIPQPKVDLQAEALIRTREGDIALIQAVVSGSISNPQIRFTSDRGLRQRDILTLITSGTGLLTDGRSGTLQQDFSVQPLEFFDDDVLFGLGGWVKRLSRIDSLAFEPAFNPARGTIDPTIVASKYLFGDITLVGRSAFSSSNPEASVELRKPLTNKLEARLIGQSYSTQTNNALEGLLAYSALTNENSNTVISVDDNSRWLSEGLSQQLEQRLGQRLAQTDMPFVEQKAKDFLKADGYFEPSVTSTCSDNHASYGGKKICGTVTVKVSRGQQGKIRRRVIGSTMPLENNLKGQLAEVVAKVRHPVTSETDEAKNRLLEVLRHDGYALARCEIEYEPSEKKLTAHVVPGKKYELNFTGNTTFSASDFLDSINYFKYPRPFGTTFITVLLEGMERLYSKAGFPLVTFAVTNKESSDKRTVVIVIDEGPRLGENAPVINGLTTVTTQDLMQWMRESNSQATNRIFSGNAFSKEQATESLRFIESILRSHGFTAPEVRLEYKNTDDSHVVPQIHIVEGPRETLLKIIPPNLPDGIAVSLPTEIYTGQVKEISTTLQTALQQAGYLSSTIQSAPSNNGQLLITVSPGERTVIGTITIDYDGPVSQDVIQNALQLENHSPWNEHTLDESQRRLFGLGLFKKVSLEPSDGVLDSTVENLTVTLEAQPPRILTLGIGANSEFGLHLQTTYLDRGIFQDGRTLSGQVDSYFGYSNGEITRGVVSLAYNDPNIFSYDVGFVSDIRFQRLNQDTLPFNLDRSTLSNYIHKTWDEESWPGALTATLGHSLLFENLSDVDAGAILNERLDADKNTLSFISSTVGYDARNDALLPTSGWAASLTNQFSSEAIGSDANYYIGDGKVSLISPIAGIDSRWSVASSTRGAVGITYGGDNTLPLSQRFFLGGRNSVRGFKENSLGPKGADGVAQGGDLLGVQNFELRYLVRDGVQADTFLDLGGLFQQDKKFDIQDVRRSTGFGVRYLSPIGPIGFDLGFPLDERPGESSVRFHFTIGSNF